VSARAARLRKLADELTPDRMLARIGERARFTVSAVSVVGSVVAGLGLLSVERAALPGPGRPLVLASVALAAIALLLSLSYLVVRPRYVRLGNLEEVDGWLTAEKRRIGLVVWSSRLLLAAVVFAIAAAVTVVMSSSSVSTVSVQLTGTGKQEATVQATVSGASPGERFTVRLLSAPDAAGPALMVGQLTADGSGKATLSATVGELPATQRVTAQLSRQRELLASATADLNSLG
jgi:hypothetical protein